MRLTFDTTEFLASGLPSSRTKCPVAMAIEAKIRPEVGVSVGTKTVTLLDYQDKPTCPVDWCQTFALPIEIQARISHFDRHRGEALTAPVVFELDIPEKFLRPEVIAQAVAPKPGPLRGKSPLILGTARK